MNKQILALLIMPILLMSCRAPSQENEQSAQDPTLCKEEDFVALTLDPSYNPTLGYWNDGNQERGQVRGIIEIERQNLPD